jgi:tetratricopeptide (TPR) repeat protein
MNNSKKLILGLAFVGATNLITSCKNPVAEMIKGAKDQKLTVEPNPLELHGDRVPFKMSAELPVKMMKKGTDYTLEVYYVAGDIDAMQDLQPLPADAAKIKAITFKGDEYVGATKNPKKDEAMEFAYLDKYERGGLFIKGIAAKADKPEKKKEFGPLRLVVMDGRKVKGVATTSRLLKSPVAGLTPVAGETPFIYADHGYVKPGDETLTARLDFERGSVNVKQEYMNNKSTMEIVSELFKSSQVPAFTATGISSHSPEGQEAVNVKLSEGRAMALEMTFKKMLELFKYDKEKIKDYVFNIEKRKLGETLPEFNQLVDASSLTPEQKNEAKEIMGASSDFVEKEMQLQRKPYYKNLMDEVYPRMRYASTSVRKPGAAKTEPEMSALTQKMMKGDANPNELNEQEFLMIASKTPDLEERIKILKLAAQNYQTWKVHNNLGAAYLDKALMNNNNRADVDEAIKQFEASMKKKETGEAAYNAALGYAMKGDMAKMEEYLNKAVALGSAEGNAKFNTAMNGAKAYTTFKQARDRNDGKYKEAERLLDNAPMTNPNLFNKGLAIMMQGINYDAAIASFNSAAQKNPKDAITPYALAVAYARKGDKSAMSGALKKACELDSNLKAKALKDVEFDKFKDDASFKDAIK